MSPIARRDLLKIAAAASSGVTAKGIERAVPAAAALAQEPTLDTHSPGSIGDANPLVPEEFAAALESIGLARVVWFDNGAAEEVETYKQAFDRLLATFGLDEMRLIRDHPANLMDEAVVHARNAMYLPGIRVGAAAEHLRVALTSSRMLCRPCP